MNIDHSPYQIHSLFGAGYVPEHHADDFQPSLLPRDTEPRELHFAEILKALRSALGLGR